MSRQSSSEAYLWIPALLGGLTGLFVFVWMVYPSPPEALIVLLVGGAISVAIGVFLSWITISIPIAAAIGHSKNADRVRTKSVVCAACRKRPASLETQWHYGTLTGSGGWGSLMGAHHRWAEYRVLGHVVEHFCGACAFRRVVFHLFYSLLPLSLTAAWLWVYPGSLAEPSALRVVWACIYIGSAVATAVIAARFGEALGTLLAFMHLLFGFIIAMGFLFGEFALTTAQYYAIGSIILCVVLTWLVSLGYHEVASAWAISIAKTRNALPKGVTAWTDGYFISMKKKH